MISIYMYCDFVSLNIESIHLLYMIKHNFQAYPTSWKLSRNPDNYVIILQIFIVDMLPIVEYLYW